MNSTLAIKWYLENSFDFDSSMNWFYCLVLNISYQQVMREAGIKFEFYCFWVSMGLDPILTSSLNDDTLSILRIIVYID